MLRTSGQSARSAPVLIVGMGRSGERTVSGLPSGFATSSPQDSLGIDMRWRSPSSPRDFVPVREGLSGLADAVARTGARKVIVASDAGSAGLGTCRRLGLRVLLAPGLPESLDRIMTVQALTGLRLPSVRSAGHRWQLACKHGFDRALALILLLALAPAMVTIAIGVRLSSPGPALFRQRRVGRNGRPFELLKFRTMYGASGPPTFSLPKGLAPGGVEGTDRRTRLGRWLRSVSFDELPQLVNVLRGEMSLVGPRPERPEFVARFAAQVGRYQERHRMRPGITGWAQVNGLRGQTSIAARVELDNCYVANWSPGLDVRILALTAAEILGLRGRRR